MKNWVILTEIVPSSYNTQHHFYPQPPANKHAHIQNTRMDLFYGLADCLFIYLHNINNMKRIFFIIIQKNC